LSPARCAAWIEEGEAIDKERAIVVTHGAATIASPGPGAVLQGERREIRQSRRLFRSSTTGGAVMTARTLARKRLAREMLFAKIARLGGLDTESLVVLLVASLAMVLLGVLAE
jgi:hypothetical protein